MVALNENFACENPALGSKNRVGNFFGRSAVRAGENRPATRNRIGEKRPTLTIIVSGRPVWPSRDPIGESGGLNLYGMVGGEPIGSIDILGLVTYLLFTGENTKSPPVDFSGAADARKDEIEAMSDFDSSEDEVKILQAHVFSDIKNAIESNSCIAEISYFGHSGPGILYLGGASGAETNATIEGGDHVVGYFPLYSEGTTLNSMGLNTIDYKNLEKNGEVRIRGCNSSGIAGDWASHIGNGWSGSGISGTCYFPRIDGVTVPMGKLKYAWHELIIGDTDAAQKKADSGEKKKKFEAKSGKKVEGYVK